MLKLNNLISLVNGADRYTITIDRRDEGKLNLSTLAIMLNKSIRETLDIIETKGGLVTTNNCMIFFKNENDANLFIKDLNL